MCSSLRKVAGTLSGGIQAHREYVCVARRTQLAQYGVFISTVKRSQRADRFVRNRFCTGTLTGPVCIGRVHTVAVITAAANMQICLQEHISDSVPASEAPVIRCALQSYAKTAVMATGADSPTCGPESMASQACCIIQDKIVYWRLFVCVLLPMYANTWLPAVFHYCPAHANLAAGS